MNLEQAIELHNEARRLCFELMRRKPDLYLGEQSWLKYAIGEEDINLLYGPDYVTCYGSCFSMQTMGHEHFNFDIGLKELHDLGVQIF